MSPPAAASTKRPADDIEVDVLFVLDLTAAFDLGCRTTASSTAQDLC
jgi:hypothetical protein